MKKILSLFVLGLTALCAQAQGCDIPLNIVFPKQIEGFTPQSTAYLRNVLTRSMLQEGEAAVGAVPSGQFGLVVTCDVVDKHIIAGAPEKTVLNLSLSLYVADLVGGTKFAAYTTDLSGVGNNLTKAYNSAIHKLSPARSDLRDFVVEGRAKLLAYYDRNYAMIIKQAQSLAATRQYEDALYHLLSIPVCSKGYNAAQREVRVVYKQYVDRLCEENLAQAQAAWMTGFTKENAAIAAVFLAEIYPDAACYGDAQQLVREIKQHMGEAWRFEMKQWSDLVDVEKQRLQHAREIALAFAQNQPQQVINFVY